MYTLHKLPEGFIVTSDEEITGLENNIPVYNNGRFWIWENTMALRSNNKPKKVIAQQHQIDFSSLSEEEQREIGWYDVSSLGEDATNLRILKHKTANQIARQYYDGYLDGFKKAVELLSDKRFTLNDIQKALQELSIRYSNGYERDFDTDFQEADFIIQSISKPKSWSVEGEWNEDKFNVLKINKQ